MCVPEHFNFSQGESLVKFYFSAKYSGFKEYFTPDRYRQEEGGHVTHTLREAQKNY